MSVLMCVSFIVTNTMINKNDIPSTTTVSTNDNKIDKLNNNNTDRTTTIPWTKVLLEVCTNKDSLLVIVSTFFFSYTLFSSDILIPLVCLVTFQWDVSSLTYIFIGYGAAYFVVLVLMSRLCKNSHSVYYCTLFCTVMQVLQYMFLLSISVVERQSDRDVVLITFFLLSGMVVWTVEEVLLRKLISNMVPSKVQSFTESIRSGFARLGECGIANPQVPCRYSVRW